MSYTFTNEVNALNKKNIEAIVTDAHVMRSQFAYDAVKSLVVSLKHALKSKSNVQGGSNLAHPA